MVACRRMCLRPKLLQLDRGSMHPRLEAVVLGDMHVQGEEVDEGLKKQSMPPYRWVLLLNMSP